MQNLLLRVITSILLLPIVLLAFYAGGWFLVALLLLVVILCSYEVANMVMPKNNQAAILSCIAGAFLMLSLMYFKKANSIPALSAIIFVINMIFLFSQHDKKIWEKITSIFYMIFYVSLGISSLYWLRVSEIFNSAYTGLAFIIVACATTWGNDTFAYFGGRFYGKTPLFSRVSAKKTWEGFFFGALGSILSIFILYAIFPLSWIKASLLSFSDCFFIAVPAIVLAPLGDLIESRFKRVYLVKDSSQILPGHGGFLDRIDGLLVVLPWTALYAFFIRPLW